MDATSVIRIALQIISDRLITILALQTSFGLGCWTMWGPTWERVVTLAIFSVFAYLLVRNKGETNELQT